MLLVVDTNVLISGLVWRGPPGHLTDAIIDKVIQAALSPPAIVELRRAMTYPRIIKHIKGGQASAEEAVTRLVGQMILVEAHAIEAVSRDPDDDKFLAIALACKAEMIVTGDKDLLVLESYEGIEIVTPAEALRRISPPPG